VLFVAPVIILLGHACIPLAGGHADVLSLLMGEHHTPDEPHHRMHLVACDQVPVKSTGSFQVPMFNQVGDVTATSIDSAPIIDSVLPIWTPKLAFRHLPIFLLHTSLLI
jgi:hypothetical protein